MLYWYLVSLKNDHLARMWLKSDKKFWHWVYLHYKNPTEETAFQVERWRRINYMIHDEMHNVDRR